MWPIEENARIVRNWVWFKPPKPPTIAERPLIIAVSFTFMGERINWDKIAKGASFCHLKRRKRLSQDIEAAILGTQWWKGARPILSLNLAMIRKVSWVKKGKNERTRSEKRRSAELNAWTIKYFTADSVDEGEGRIINSGMKEIRLNSRPVHIPTQE